MRSVAAHLSRNGGLEPHITPRPEDRPRCPSCKGDSPRQRRAVNGNISEEQLNSNKRICVGLAAAHLVEGLGAELYTQFDVFDLDESGILKAGDIYVGTAGVRIKC